MSLYSGKPVLPGDISIYTVMSCCEPSPELDCHNPEFWCRILCQLFSAELDDSKACFCYEGHRGYTAAESSTTCSTFNSYSCILLAVLYCVIQVGSGLTKDAKAESPMLLLRLNQSYDHSDKLHGITVP